MTTHADAVGAGDGAVRGATKGATGGLTRSRAQWAGWSSFIVRPSVALSIPWVGVCALSFIFQIVTVRFPADPSELVRLVSPTQFGWITAINAALLAALVVEGKQGFSSPRDLKRAHLVSVALALVLLVMLQVVVFLASEPLVLPVG